MPSKKRKMKNLNIERTQRLTGQLNDFQKIIQSAFFDFIDSVSRVIFERNNFWNESLEVIPL